MVATVFDVFKEIDYNYLKISRGTVYGNMITETIPLKGVFKLRSGMTQGDMELAQSSATLHAHPEDFTDIDEIVGNGVEVGGEYYQITGITDGRNFDSGISEHITLTLGVADYAIESEN